MRGARVYIMRLFRDINTTYPHEFFKIFQNVSQINHKSKLPESSVMFCTPLQRLQQDSQNGLRNERGFRQNGTQGPPLRAIFF